MKPLSSMSHKPVGFKSYDGDISFEQLCSCGYHTPHDINFLNHIEKNTMKPYFSMPVWSGV